MGRGYSLNDKVREGADDALDRLFPRFTDADHKNWPVVISRARSGDDTPLSVVDWNGITEGHVVTREVLSKVGAEMSGSDVRKIFGAPPFGWPQDAADGALIALHAGGHLNARYNHAPLAVGHLDQNKIAKTDFRHPSVKLISNQKRLEEARGRFRLVALKIVASVNHQKALRAIPSSQEGRYSSQTTFIFMRHSENEH